ncbi:uncharacterized protein MELLADRAFT_103530 [Melampsora larici-populina 98AG31]|uniref:Uncharacterized protein n=1 Tax=Melampsora larici-populina (strain 98AG31 / pathotype 3-4-7) TaxID=747676 RepID=F4RBM8_MELLP|nr:uncharacterized protein MELLADRAFT_103530 [Melampsora larici-populina 98AG31]EGG10127.1 hypothetical protein MELLADRAFT_103530 [Melampsora larici-populina 98AG31]
MSAQEYADGLGGIELNRRERNRSGTAQREKNGEKGKENRKDEEQSGEGNKNLGIEGGIGEQEEDQNEEVARDERMGGKGGANNFDQSNQLLIASNGTTNPIIQGNIQEMSGQGIVTGLGRSIDSSNKNTLLELTHQKWKHNIHTAVHNGNIPQFELLKNEYEKWCHKHQTPVRDIDLFDMDLDQVELNPNPVTTAEKTKDTSKSKKEVNTTMVIGEKLGNHMTSRGGYHNQGNQSWNRGGNQSGGGDRPAIGPGSFNRLMIEGNQNKGGENNAPTASGSK